jgi:gluconolactonase
MKSKLLLCTVPILGLVSAAFNDIISVDPQLTYRILPSFSGNVSQNFIDTSIPNTTTSSVFSSARNASFISYSNEFISLLGPAPTLELVQQRNYSFANEAGIWVPDRNEVWFTSSDINGVTYIFVLDLETNAVKSANLSQSIINANGGYFFDGKIYFASDGNATVIPAIWEIDPATGDAEVLINSYFGLPFNGPNDIIWVKNGRGEKQMFWTDDPLSFFYNGGPKPSLVDAVWRFSPKSQSLVPVISRADVLVPNGIAVNREFTKLYVTDTLPIVPGADSAETDSGSNAVFVFDLWEDCEGELWPVNKRLFGIARTGLPDGIKVDDKGRVWTGEGEGIVVRGESGRVLGLFNTETLQVKGSSDAIANFALANDTLIIEANENLWRVSLGEVLMGPEKFYR